MAEHITHILEPGGSEINTAAGGARVHRKPLRDLRWCDLRVLLGESLDLWSQHNATRLGAALSFYTLLSLAPLVLFLVAVVSLVIGPTHAAEGIVRQVRIFGGVEAAQAVQALLLTPRSAAHGIIATVVSVLTLLFGASGVMVELRDALNTIWDVPVPQTSGMNMVRQFVRDRLFSFALILAVGFLLIVSLAISTWIAALGAYSASILPAHALILNVANFLLSILIIALLFAAIYKFLPYTRIEWYEVILGGAVTSVLFTLGKFLLGFYLGRASFASAYGAAASIVVLIAWVYYSAQIFFLGAEFTRVFATHYGPPRHRRDAHVVAPGEPSAQAEQPMQILTPADANRPAPMPDAE